MDSGPLRSGADGMTLDADGFLYVATKLGIQIVDPAGKTVGILRKPDNSDPSNVVFAGPTCRRCMSLRAIRSSAGQSRKKALFHGCRSCRRSHGCDGLANFGRR